MTTKTEVLRRPSQGARDLLVTTVLLLVAAGTVMVFSAGAFYRSAGGDVYFYLKRQLLWLPIAFSGLYAASRLKPDVLRRHHTLPLVIAVGMLAAVLIPHVGRNVNASRRWLPLAGGLQFQPSELAKIAIILFLAGFLTADPRRRRSFLRGFVPVCLVTAPVFGLILVEPDFGTAMFVLGLASCVLFLGGLRLRYFVASAVVFAPPVAWFVHHRWEQIQVRLLGFLEPESIYQVKQSLVALGSGGLWGQGLGAGVQKLRFLPEAHTDFILAIVGEELGYVGCLGIVLLFALLLWSGVRMVWTFRDRFAFLVGSGIVISLSFQAAFNMAVVTASAPTKGISLPLITFGGSGLCTALFQIGILLALDRENRLRFAAADPRLSSAGRGRKPGDASRSKERSGS